MLLIKYEKTDIFIYNSYLNCRDVIIQTFKRAGIKLSYSQGFNPHELMFFSPPTSLGVESCCEYMYIISDYATTVEFKRMFNKYAPRGIKVDIVKEIREKPNFYELIDYAKYQIVTDSNISKNIIETLKNTDDFKNKIYSITYDKDTINCIVACGQKSNLKITKMADVLQSLSIATKNIKKLNLYKNSNDKLIEIDNILFNW